MTWTPQLIGDEIFYLHPVEYGVRDLRAKAMRAGITGAHRKTKETLVTELTTR